MPGVQSLRVVKKAAAGFKEAIVAVRRCQENDIFDVL